VELDYENLELDHLRSVSEFAGFVAGLRAAAV
jgi:acyl carrier protein